MLTLLAGGFLLLSARIDPTEVVKLVPTEGPVEAMQFTPDGAELVVLKPHGLYIHELKGGAVTRKYDRESYGNEFLGTAVSNTVTRRAVETTNFNAFAVSGDGDRIVIEMSGILKVISAKTMLKIQDILAPNDNTSNTYALAWSPSGKAIALMTYADNKGETSVVDAGEAHKLIAEIHDGWSGVGFSPDGKRIYTGVRDLTAYDSSTGKAIEGETFTPMATIDGEVVPLPNIPFFTSVSPDGTMVLFGHEREKSGPTDRNSDPRTYKIGSRVVVGQVVAVYAGFDHSILCGSWSKDSSLVALGGSDGTFGVFDAKNGTTKMLKVYKGHRINSVALAPNGKCVAIGADDGSALVLPVSAD